MHFLRAEVLYSVSSERNSLEDHLCILNFADIVSHYLQKFVYFLRLTYLLGMKLLSVDIWFVITACRGIGRGGLSQGSVQTCETSVRSCHYDFKVTKPGQLPHNLTEGILFKVSFYIYSITSNWVFVASFCFYLLWDLFMSGIEVCLCLGSGKVFKRLVKI